MPQKTAADSHRLCDHPRAGSTCRTEATYAQQISPSQNVSILQSHLVLSTLKSVISIAPGEPITHQIGAKTLMYAYRKDLAMKFWRYLCSYFGCKRDTNEEKGAEHREDVRFEPAPSSATCSYPTRVCLGKTQSQARNNMLHIVNATYVSCLRGTSGCNPPCRTCVKAAHPPIPPFQLLVPTRESYA